MKAAGDEENWKVSITCLPPQLQPSNVCSSPESAAPPENELVVLGVSWGRRWILFFLISFACFSSMSCVSESTHRSSWRCLSTGHDFCKAAEIVGQCTTSFCVLFPVLICAGIVQRAPLPQLMVFCYLPWKMGRLGSAYCSPLVCSSSPSSLAVKSVSLFPISSIILIVLFIFCLLKSYPREPSFSL